MEKDYLSTYFRFVEFRERLEEKFQEIEGWAPEQFESVVSHAIHHGRLEVIREIRNMLEVEG